MLASIKSNLFDLFMEADVLAARSLLTSKNRHFKLTDSIKVLSMYKTFRLCHIHILCQFPVKKSDFLHLSTIFHNHNMQLWQVTL